MNHEEPGHRARGQARRDAARLVLVGRHDRIVPAGRPRCGRVALHTQAESERKWCSVVGTLDDSYRRQPPTTPTGMSVAKSIHDLRRELHCPAGD
jgi:hypothetical protein